MFQKKLKQNISEILYDLKRSRFSISSLKYWTRIVFRSTISLQNLKIFPDIDHAVEVYTTAFCLTRSGDRLPFEEDQIKEIARFGIKIDKTWGVCGATLKYAKGYESTHYQVLTEMLRTPQIVSHPFYKSYLLFLNERYVGHRRHHTNRSGKIDNTDFSVVATDDHTTRENGYISTFSQQTCIVVIGWDERNFGLGHWKRANIKSAQVFAQKWKNVTIVRRMSSPSVTGKNLTEILFGEDQVSSIKVTYTCSPHLHVIIEHETHNPTQKKRKYGPLAIQPLGKTKQHHFPTH